MRRSRPRRRRAAVEWPTVLLAAAIYGGWSALTFWHAAIPGPLLFAAGGWWIAWHGSLQHETIHGHPTRSAPANWMIGFPPLALWLPYSIYRRTHLLHHRAATVTHPLADPESRYVASGCGPLARAVANAQKTLIARIVLGPLLTVPGFLAAEARRALAGPVRVLGDWLPHLAGVAAVVAWLDYCELSPGRYLLLFVYPGTALTLLRSFAEHRADPEPARRVAVVEAGGPFALLYLNNNLHAAHHARPALAWYRLPAFYRERRAALLRQNGGLRYGGYGDVARRFLLRAHDRIDFPRGEAEA